MFSHSFYKCIFLFIVIRFINIESTIFYIMERFFYITEIIFDFLHRAFCYCCTICLVRGPRSYLNTTPQNEMLVIYNKHDALNRYSSR